MCGNFLIELNAEAHEIKWTSSVCGGSYAMNLYYELSTAMVINANKMDEKIIV